jgi:hypothetical protein
MKNIPLLSFAKPDKSSCEKLRRILAGCEICRLPTKVQYRSKADVAVEGGLDQVIEALEQCLQDDYKGNLKESETAAWKFEYAINNSTLLKGGLDVLTCLTTPGEKGSTCYGRTVLRTGPDKYLLWIDD